MNWLGDPLDGPLWPLAFLVVYPMSPYWRSKGRALGRTRSVQRRSTARGSENRDEDAAQICP
jgi:hypothetical protein